MFGDSGSSSSSSVSPPPRPTLLIFLILIITCQQRLFIQIIFSMTLKITVTTMSCLDNTVHVFYKPTLLIQ